MQHDAIRALVNVCVAAVLSAPPMIHSQSAPDSNAPAIKPRIFITESQSWEYGSQGGGGGGVFFSRGHGGARPQTAEIIKTFGQKCPDVTINNRQEMADYIVLLDHEGGKGALSHKNKIAVFEHVSGDALFSKSTLSLGGSVEDACKAITQHWAIHSKSLLAAKDPPSSPALSTPVAAPPPAPANPPAPSTAAAAAPPPVVSTPPKNATPSGPSLATTLTLESTPAGADIEVDGAYVGNTPSTLTLSPGSHEITVRKKGYTVWTRKMNVLSGSVHLTADLAQEAAK